MNAEVLVARGAAVAVARGDHGGSGAGRDPCATGRARLPQSRRGPRERSLHCRARQTLCASWSGWASPLRGMATHSRSVFHGAGAIPARRSRADPETPFFFIGPAVVVLDGGPNLFSHVLATATANCVCRQRSTRLTGFLATTHPLPYRVEWHERRKNARRAKEAPAVAKTALCVGINDYQGAANDLRGCLNDAADWTKALKARGYSVTSLRDKKATKAAMVAALTKLVADAASGDSIVFTYSGHGSFVPDLDRDEPDGVDEVLCPWDIVQQHFITDDELYDIFAQRERGVRSRSSPTPASPAMSRDSARRSEMGRHACAIPPPARFLSKKDVEKAKRAGPAMSRRRPSLALLLAGCQDTQVSLRRVVRQPREWRLHLRRSGGARESPDGGVVLGLVSRDPRSPPEPRLPGGPRHRGDESAASEAGARMSGAVRAVRGDPDDVARALAPIVALHPDDTWAPCDPGAFLARCELRFRRGDKQSTLAGGSARPIDPSRLGIAAAGDAYATPARRGDRPFLAWELTRPVLEEHLAARRARRR